MGGGDLFKHIFKKWYFQSIFDPFWPKWVKMAKNYFFPDSEAKWFLTRGHMPKFQQIQKMVLSVQKRVVGPKKAN